MKVVHLQKTHWEEIIEFDLYDPARSWHNEASSPEQVTMFSEQLRQMILLLPKLKPIQEKVLRMRLGLGEDKSYSLTEIAKDFELSRLRIQQIERNAISKIRSIARDREQFAEMRRKYAYSTCLKEMP
jgi:RNA polymerase sigma factor (sigma-70 family)